MDRLTYFFASSSASFASLFFRGQRVFIVGITNLTLRSPELGRTTRRRRAPGRGRMGFTGYGEEDEEEAWIEKGKVAWGAAFHEFPSLEVLLCINPRSALRQFFNGGCANLSVMKSSHVDGVKRNIRICVYIFVLNVHLFRSFRGSAFSSDALNTMLASTRIYLVSFSGNQCLWSFPPFSLRSSYTVANICEPRPDRRRRYGGPLVPQIYQPITHRSIEGSNGIAQPRRHSESQAGYP